MNKPEDLSLLVYHAMSLCQSQWRHIP